MARHAGLRWLGVQTHQILRHGFGGQHLGGERAAGHLPLSRAAYQPQHTARGVGAQGVPKGLRIGVARLTHYQHGAREVYACIRQQPLQGNDFQAGGILR